MDRKDPLLVCWVMFANDTHPTSMRSVLGMRLAETSPVVIIERSLSVLRTHRISSLDRRVSRIARTGWRYHPLHFPERIPGLSSSATALNRMLLQRELNRLIPEGTTRIVCYDSPTQHHLVRKLGEHLSIYLAIDDRTRTVWGKPISGELEAEKLLLGKVNAVICVSEFLAETLKARIPAGRNIPVDVLPNGYDDRLFDPGRSYEKPPALANVSKPSILVAGHVSERIDWDGISAAARARPEWTWLFVGPADRGLPKKIDLFGRSCIPCHDSNSPRLLWKPPVPVEQMPALISHCDACAVPYRLNPFTLASSPLKGIEYLAMGAPVLSTRIPALQRYGSAIQWVEQGNGESYARALDHLKTEQRNSSAFEARRSAVSRDSHEDRVREFLQIVWKVNLSTGNFQSVRQG
jgi:glycosyltransferase involved in cell wall biosynthesis